MAGKDVPIHHVSKVKNIYWKVQKTEYGFVVNHGIISFFFLASEHLPEPKSTKSCLKTYCVCGKPEEKGRLVKRLCCVCP